MYIGIDVGGTNLKAGLVDEAGNILAAERIPLDFQGPEAFAETLAELSKKVLREGVEWVGMGLPGTVDGGDVLYTTNIPMENVPLERLFRQHLDMPLLLGNDADCAAVGEFFCGAGKGTQDFAVVTLGTGVGTGLILGGKLRGGMTSCEAGHTVICRGGELCNCGRRGCWERYASATGLIQQTKRAMESHSESALHTLAAESGVEGRTAFQAAAAGDKTALNVCRQYAEYLAEGLTNFINTFRLEAVAIGGGVAGAPEHLLLEPVREIVSKECFSSHGGRTTRILTAKLGNDAGIIGAAMLGRVL